MPVFNSLNQISFCSGFHFQFQGFVQYSGKDTMPLERYARPNPGVTDSFLTFPFFGGGGGGEELV